jgi:hypothetical protein
MEGGKAPAHQVSRFPSYFDVSQAYRYFASSITEDMLLSSTC